MDKRTRAPARTGKVKVKKITDAQLIEIGKKHSKGIKLPSPEYRFEEEKNCNIHLQEKKFYLSS
jgi:hypothetical protein|tara:strand:- start:2770 stop:2961 length:192 start_codon:yes stop_codon:yes gene_type:complete